MTVGNQFEWLCLWDFIYFSEFIINLVFSVHVYSEHCIPDNLFMLNMYYFEWYICFDLFPERIYYDRAYFDFYFILYKLPYSWLIVISFGSKDLVKMNESENLFFSGENLYLSKKQSVGLWNRGNKSTFNDLEYLYLSENCLLSIYFLSFGGTFLNL